VTGHGIGFGEAARVWARIALLSFGGPAGQIAVMHRILVEEKGWIGEHRFLHALNFCMLLPGPEAQQLATYIGWLLHGVRGGLVAGILFVLPGLVAIMALSWLYFLYGNVAPVEALFFGLKAAVLAIVLDAVRRIGARALTNRTLLALAAAAFLALFFLAVPFPVIVLAAGAIGYAGGRLKLAAFSTGAEHNNTSTIAAVDAPTALGDATPNQLAPSWRRSLRLGGLLVLLWLGPLAALVAWRGADDVFAHIGIFFSTMAVVTFGGAYAVLSYVAQQAVETYGWLRPGEMLDGLGLAETTPGPLIMVTQFVGFLGAARGGTGLNPLLAGTLGGLLTTWVTFTPSFLWIFVGAPFSERLRGHAALSAALTAITAAVVGVILNLALWFALHTLFAELRPFRSGPVAVDLPLLSSLRPMSLLLTAAALVAMFRFRAGPLAVLASCALAGTLAWVVSPPIH
jgi:chromate transporter